MKIKVKMTNFMQHTNQEIEFDGFSMLSAINGGGKSSILYCILWIINGGTNKHITWGENYCKCEIELNNISYTRIADGGKYSVEKDGVKICDTKASFKDIGIDLGLEFRSQFDKLFLLSETPKARTELLNEMFDIESLENGFSNLKKDLKSERLELIEAEGRLSLLEDKKLRLEELITLKTSYDSVVEKLNILELIKSKINSKVILPNIITQDIISHEKLNILRGIDFKIKSKVNVGDRVLLTVDTNRICILEEISSKLKNKTVLPSTIKLGVNIHELSVLEKIKYLRSQYVTIDDLQEELNQINNKLKGEVCPLCQNKM